MLLYCFESEKSDSKCTGHGGDVDCGALDSLWVVNPQQIGCCSDFVRLSQLFA